MIAVIMTSTKCCPFPQTVVYDASFGFSTFVLPVGWFGTVGGEGSGQWWLKRHHQMEMENAVAGWLTTVGCVFCFHVPLGDKRFYYFVLLFYDYFIILLENSLQICEKFEKLCNKIKFTIPSLSNKISNLNSLVS